MKFSFTCPKSGNDLENSDTKHTFLGEWLAKLVCCLHVSWCVAVARRDVT